GRTRLPHAQGRCGGRRGRRSRRWDGGGRGGRHGERGRGGAGYRVLADVSGDALAVLELDAGTVVDIARAGGTENQDDLAARAGWQRVEAPEQFRLTEGGLGRGADERGVGRQRVAHEDMVGRGLRAVGHADVVFQLLP